MKPATPAQEKLKKLYEQRAELEHKIDAAKAECNAEGHKILEDTGFPPGLPETADDWQLYSTTKGREACGRHLSAALKKELLRFRKRTADIGARKAGLECYNRMYDLLHKNSKYGAADTEGRVTMENAIELYAKAFGFDVRGVF